MLFSVNEISCEIPGRSRRFPRSQNKIPPCPHKKLPPFHSGVLLGWGGITQFRNSSWRVWSKFQIIWVTFHFVFRSFCIVKVLQILSMTEHIETFLKTFCKICCYTFSNKWRTLYSDCILTQPAKEGLLKHQTLPEYYSFRVMSRDSWGFKRNYKDPRTMHIQYTYIVLL